MKGFKAVITVLCVFAPILMAAYAIGRLPDPWQFVEQSGGLDWMWLLLLGLMMVGTYYFLAVYLEEENEIELDFKALDADHDGYLRREDVAAWEALTNQFNRFDSDHDGKMSRLDFERFEHALPR